MISIALEEAEIQKQKYEFPIVIKDGYVDNKRVEFVFNCSMDSGEYIVENDCVEIAKETVCKANSRVLLEPWDVKIFIKN